MVTMIMTIFSQLFWQIGQLKTIHPTAFDFKNNAKFLFQLFWEEHNLLL